MHEDERAKREAKPFMNFETGEIEALEHADRCEHGKVQEQREQPLTTHGCIDKVGRLNSRLLPAALRLTADAALFKSLAVSAPGLTGMGGRT